jgi:hypothetical protein
MVCALGEAHSVETLFECSQGGVQHQVMVFVFAVEVEQIWHVVLVAAVCTVVVDSS